MTEIDIDLSSIIVHLDMSSEFKFNYKFNHFTNKYLLLDSLIANFLQRDILYALISFTNNLMTACNINPAIIQTPLNFKTPIYGEEKINFTNFTAPGIILT